jgi:CRP-like cAMP-binding protein
MRAKNASLQATQDRVMRMTERTADARKRVSNKILLTIPDEEYSLIRPHLEFLTLPHHLNLYKPNQLFKFVYFPNAGMVSLVVETEDGKTVEVGEVGKEGFAGIPAVAGLSRSHVREIVQISGDAFRMRVGALQSVLQSTSALPAILSRYTVIQGMSIAQTAACNRLHNIEQRLARWLLITQDRVGSATLAITHDFLAMMLGTDRPTVSLAAGVLQKRQAIEYKRGAVQILSRVKLKHSTCECYEATQKFNLEMELR